MFKVSFNYSQNKVCFAYTKYALFTFSVIWSLSYCYRAVPGERKVSYRRRSRSGENFSTEPCPRWGASDNNGTMPSSHCDLWPFNQHTVRDLCSVLQQWSILWYSQESIQRCNRRTHLRRSARQETTTLVCRSSSSSSSSSFFILHHFFILYWLTERNQTSNINKHESQFKYTIVDVVNA